MIPKSCVIIGGGASIKDGLKKDLWSKLEGLFTMSCNFAVYHYTGTVATYIDKGTYNDNAKFREHPLIVGRYDKEIIERPPRVKPNLIMLKIHNRYWGRDGIKRNQIYSGGLTGGWSMSLAISLGVTRLFLLGFDFGNINREYEDVTNKKIQTPLEGNNIKNIIEEDNKKLRFITHYYHGENIEHRGMGLINWYRAHRPGEAFLDFKLNTPDIEILNVSPNSNIDTFPKINYDAFFELIKNEPKYDQDQLRKDIKIEIKKQNGGVDVSL